MLLLVMGMGILLAAGCSSTKTTTSAPPATIGTSSSLGAPSTSTPTSEITAGGPSSTNLPGEAATEGQRLSPATGAFAICKDCHAFLDPPNRPRPALNATFRHEKHLARGATCESCHVPPVHQESGIRRPGMADCYHCHSSNPGSSAPANCDLCHPPEFKTLPSSHTQQFYQGDHAQVVAVQGTKECFACHPGDETTFCLGCHKLPMPHPEGWVRASDGSAGEHVTQAYSDPQVCVQCHQNKVAPPAGCYGGECHGT